MSNGWQSLEMAYTAGKAVFAAMEECRELNKRDARLYHLKIYPDGSCAITTPERGDHLSFYSLSDLLGILTKPGSLVWEKGEDDAGNTAYISGSYKVRQVIRENLAGWEARYRGSRLDSLVYSKSHDAKAACEKHRREVMSKD